MIVQTKAWRLTRAYSVAVSGGKNKPPLYALCPGTSSDTMSRSHSIIP